MTLELNKRYRERQTGAEHDGYLPVGLKKGKEERKIKLKDNKHPLVGQCSERELAALWDVGMIT